MHVKLLRWGNSYGVRISKARARELGVREGETMDARFFSLRGKAPVDFANLPTGRDPDPRASERHDDYLYGDRE